MTVKQTNKRLVTYLGGWCNIGTTVGNLDVQLTDDIGEESRLSARPRGVIQIVFSFSESKTETVRERPERLPCLFNHRSSLYLTGWEASSIQYSLYILCPLFLFALPLDNLVQPCPRLRKQLPLPTRQAPRHRPRKKRAPSVVTWFTNPVRAVS